MYLETERLIIRDFVLEDADALEKIKYDKQVMDFVPSLIKRDATIDDIREAIMYYDSVKGTGKYEEEILYAVVLKECLTIIGVITLSDAKFLNEPQVGWMMRGEYGRKGYASEAANAVTDYLFTTHPYDYLIVVMDIDNPASYQTALKCGFNLFEKRTVYDYKYGRYCDDYYYFRKYNPNSKTRCRFYGDVEYNGRHS
ncbi:GNAT family N-acetyltransferase [Gorillibacterium timonense]|uniref:GNAT family N-acetyltransferase n=1 Tax=Gorillibacterium timonense TaxID=1689269 RepID=UPI00071CF679|nr:GNAT family N-acetyltransferase [Gorillibacterium timonense]